jgi:hypothetical protein
MGSLEDYPAMASAAAAAAFARYTPAAHSDAIASIVFDDERMRSPTPTMLGRPETNP